MRLFSSLHLIAILLLVPTVCVAQGDPINIGALYNLTGGMSAIDGPSCRGSKLAVKLLNEKGGILGGRKIELVVIDTKTDPKAPKKAAEKLVAIPVVAGLGYGDSDAVLSSAPVFQEHGIPFLTSGATDPSLPKKIGNFMFMLPWGDNDQAYAVADYAYKKLQAKNVALWINKSTEFTRLLGKYFKERYVSLGGKIVVEESFEGDKKDFSEMIKKLQAANPKPEAIFISGNPMNAKPTIEQLRKAGMKLPILSGDGFDCDLIELLPDPEITNEVYFVTHAFLQSEIPVVKDFVEAYKKEYGESPENSFAALGFDAVNLLADAIERAGALDGKALAKALGETKDFQAVTGDKSFSRPGRVPVTPVDVVAIRRGNYELVDVWTPK